jgi:hypothetical protein
MTVPRDWAHPKTGPTLSIAVSRIGATESTLRKDILESGMWHIPARSCTRLCAGAIWTSLTFQLMHTAHPILSVFATRGGLTGRVPTPGARSVSALGSSILVREPTALHGTCGVEDPIGPRLRGSSRGVVAAAAAPGGGSGFSQPIDAKSCIPMSEARDRQDRSRSAAALASPSAVWLALRVMPSAVQQESRVSEPVRPTRRASSKVHNVAQSGGSTSARSYSVVRKETSYGAL